jgi:hypothetical protein
MLLVQKIKVKKESLITWYKKAKLFFVLQLECPGYIKTKLDVTVCEVAFRFCDKVALRQSTRVGHHELENVAACFDVNAKSQGVSVRIIFDCINAIVIFAGEGNALG